MQTLGFPSVLLPHPESDYLLAGNQFGCGMKGTAQGKNKTVLKQNALKKKKGSTLPGRIRYFAFLHEPWKQDKNKL